MIPWSLLCTCTSQNLQKDKLITSYENTAYHARACEAIQSCGVYWIQHPSKSTNINRTKIPNQFDHLKKCLTDDVKSIKALITFWTKMENLCFLYLNAIFDFFIKSKKSSLTLKCH